MIAVRILMIRSCRSKQSRWLIPCFSRINFNSFTVKSWLDRFVVGGGGVAVDEAWLGSFGSGLGSFGAGLGSFGSTETSFSRVTLTAGGTLVFVEEACVVRLSGPSSSSDESSQLKSASSMVGFVVVGGGGGCAGEEAVRPRLKAPGY